MTLLIQFFSSGFVGGFFLCFFTMIILLFIAYLLGKRWVTEKEAQVWLGMEIKEKAKELLELMILDENLQDEIRRL